MPLGRGLTSIDTIVIMTTIEKDFHPRRYYPRRPVAYHVIAAYHKSSTSSSSGLGRMRRQSCQEAPLPTGLSDDE
jgi:hypothetical protein